MSLVKQSKHSQKSRESFLVWLIKHWCLIHFRTDETISERYLIQRAVITHCNNSNIAEICVRSSDENAIKRHSCQRYIFFKYDNITDFIGYIVLTPVYVVELFAETIWGCSTSLPVICGRMINFRFEGNPLRYQDNSFLLKKIKRYRAQLQSAFFLFHQFAAKWL